jgi:hypothetical protein
LQIPDKGRALLLLEDSRLLSIYIEFYRTAGPVVGIVEEAGLVILYRITKEIVARIVMLHVISFPTFSHCPVNVKKAGIVAVIHVWIIATHPVKMAMSFLRANKR